MKATFFVDRPVLAWVIALAFLIAGLLAVRSLPVEQYPSIAPPTLTISVDYPGADASVLETNVTQVIEQEMNGVDGVLYMESTSRSNGSASVKMTFDSGADIDTAQMDVQNRLGRVEQRLPDEVRQQGIRVYQASPDTVLLVTLSSRSGTMDTLALGNFAATRIVDELRRVKGVGDIGEYYTPYAMRVWIDHDRMAHLGLSASDVLTAVREQNSQAPGGALAERPLTGDTEITAALETQARYSSPEEFEAIVLRVEPDGASVRLGDVARVELGAKNYNASTELNGDAAASMAVKLAPGANALETAEGIKQRMSELARAFPEDIVWTIPYDSTPFIAASIKEVLLTLGQAMVLVVLVMLLFLQSWRATVIPSIVIPITLAGTCLGLWLVGFSINLLSLFAMVLAIGTLVDDAIVVVENAKRIIDEEQLTPFEATKKAMGQVSAAIIGTTLVLIAVFVPMAFFSGSTGGIYRQFAVTLAIAVAISTVMALVLTPALCATLLRPSSGAGERGRMPRPLRVLNRGLDGTATGYHRAVGGMLQRPIWFLVIFAGLVALAATLFVRLPGAFLPEEDQGSLMTVIQSPPGATAKRTEEAVRQVQAYFHDHPLVANTTLVYGHSAAGQGQGHATAYVRMVPWDERPGDEETAPELVRQATDAFKQIKEAKVYAVNRSSIPSLGETGGFSFKLQDRSGHGYEALYEAREALIKAAGKSDALEDVRPSGDDEAPRLRVRIDRIKARALGLSIEEVNATLTMAFGSAYANDFTRGGRVLQVLLQADAPFRMQPQDVLALKVLDQQGEAVPFGAFSTVEWSAGPSQLQRYNGYSTMSISGSSASGYTTGEAMAEMERLAEELPEGFDFEWSGASYEEQQASGQLYWLLGLSLLTVLMVLAGLYESWSVPIAVLLVAPFGALGAVLFSMLRGLAADVYFNVGLVAIIGLSAKTAILIVEFAIEEEAKGEPLMTAVLNAVRMRFRPILMTSLTFVLGMLPLVLSTGPGSAARNAVGTGVMGGMLLSTLLGLFYIPLFYLLVRRWLTSRRPPTRLDREKAKRRPATQGGSEQR
ncbi:multidrug efflux RND transporter permease subunit [Stutzerimonas nitrititolerans]|uniref:multidrug efflux RND transporter permease subunit n=1 Tax=Stutzerimonas nitrititolerans TaxID=2482751 RepID=UPI003AA8C6ED